jgi:MSHA pilin protein MshA
MPRFTNLQTDARIAKLNAARGAVASASTIIHASILAKNGRADAVNCASTGAMATNLAANGTACTENGLITLANGYPEVVAFGGVGAASATAGILAAAGLTLEFNPTQAQLNAEGYDYAVAGTTATVSVTGGPTPANCSFTYTEAANATSAPVISGVTVTGC